jgi:hypothetical protein
VHLIVFRRKSSADTSVRSSTRRVPPRRCRGSCSSALPTSARKVSILLHLVVQPFTADRTRRGRHLPRDGQQSGSRRTSPTIRGRSVSSLSLSDCCRSFTCSGRHRILAKQLQRSQRRHRP